MEKETLEEAAEKWIKGWGGLSNSKQSFIEGAKWQAKRNELRLKHKKALLDNCEKCLDMRIKQAERMYSDLSELRNDLYDKLPIGDVDAFEILKVIKNHLQKLDALCGNK